MLLCLKGKKTKVSSFARVNAPRLSGALAKIHLPFLYFSVKESRKAFQYIIVWKREGGDTCMRLLTRELKKQIPALYSQESELDPQVICKFFDPTGSWTWYVIEGSPVDENGFYDTDREKVDFLFFGFVVGAEPELGYFSLKELLNAKEGLTGLAALPIERDLYFKPCRLSEIKKNHGLTV
jgi:hypothetical protein